MLTFFKKDQGSLVLEAALALPFFLAFVIALICMIRIAMAETALQSSVSETTKVIATHIYPVQLLFDEASAKWEGSQAGESVNDIFGKINSAKEKADQINDFIDDYSAFIPDSLLPLVQTVQQWQDEVEKQGEEQVQKLEEQVWDPMLNSAFTPLVVMYADHDTLDVKSLKVTKVTLPNLKNKDKAYFGVEATYTMRLPIPFFRKNIQLTKRAYERVWVGA